MEREYAKYLLKKTKEDYNLIARDYARTRTFLPEDIKALGRYTQERERVLDSGCAHGQFSEVLKDKKVDYFGIDISEKLIEMAKEKYPKAKFQVTDALNLPFADNFFDKVYSLSVLHHIPSREFQLKYLKETKRVLKSGGLLILRVWDFWPRKAAGKLLLRYTLLKLIGKSKLDFKDLFLPWKNSQSKILTQRYFHCFTKRELENLVKNSDLTLKESWRAGKGPRTNIYLIAEK